MLITKVEKLSPKERFLYWIEERHNIFLKKESGKPKPWTDDEVLQNYFFTNPFRENDKVTRWFAKSFRDRLDEDEMVELIFGTVCFRWFNYIPTGEILIKENLLKRWNLGRALRILKAVRDKGEQVFTGAFMINSRGGVGKLKNICERITNVWKDREGIADDISQENTLQAVHKILTRYEGLGGFMAYEVVTDLRHTFVLRDATDIMTWCNPGPGAIRGICRIEGIPFAKGNNASSPKKPQNILDLMNDLRKYANKNLPSLAPFEMRDIEHSLCEYDKYCRALEGDGRMKRTYQGY